MACTSPNAFSTLALRICLRTRLLAAIFSFLVAACAFAAHAQEESSASVMVHLVGTGIGTRAPGTVGCVAGSTGGGC